jgi:hypothetical protein
MGLLRSAFSARTLCATPDKTSSTDKDKRIFFIGARNLLNERSVHCTERMHLAAPGGINRLR